MHPVIRALALAILLATLFVVFRFAMALRWAKRARERARDAEEARGRRVIAEVPLSEGEVVFLTEDDREFSWGRHSVEKRAIVGARLLEAGGVRGAARLAGGAAAALVFALHPLRVESVAWVTERRDVLSTFFFLLALLAYLRAMKDRKQDDGAP